jgi:hypothetical protein
LVIKSGIVSFFRICAHLTTPGQIFNIWRWQKARIYDD